MGRLIYIDIDEVVAQYSERYNEKLTEKHTLESPQIQVSFFLGPLPMAGAIGSVNRLNNDVRFNVYVLTALSTMNPACYIEKRLP